ncbi:LysR substrate-binding domain-containing protein [Streptomyces sp. JH002]|uniref:LysR substrate-binding domain-containing protein n=1 Tax=Streptomyces sp. JH002 TaxID=2763259 RepID=UPI003D806BFB
MGSGHRLRRVVRGCRTSWRPRRARTRAAASGGGPGAGAGAATGTVRIEAFRSAELYLLPPGLERPRARHLRLEPEVRIVREAAAGRADLAIARMGTSSPKPPGLFGGPLLEDPYPLVHRAGHLAPRSLP